MLCAANRGWTKGRLTQFIKPWWFTARLDDCPGPNQVWHSQQDPARRLSANHIAWNDDSICWSLCLHFCISWSHKMPSCIFSFPSFQLDLVLCHYWDHGIVPAERTQATFSSNPGNDTMSMGSMLIVDSGSLLEPIGGIVQKSWKNKIIVGKHRSPCVFCLYLKGWHQHELRVTPDLMLHIVSG